MKIDPFKPKDSAIKQIMKDVEKAEKPDDKEEQETEETQEDLAKKAQEQMKIAENAVALLEKENIDELLKVVKEEIFEKDNDKNGHINFITSMCNLRVRNYKLEEMEWIQVKLKAGRIVPALATTTAAVSGLQTIEVIKVLKGLKLESYRNAFINLSIPILTLSEPGPVVKHKIHDDLEVSVWDQWVYEFGEEKGDSLDELYTFIKEKYKIVPVDLFKGNKAIFFSTISKFDDFKDKKLSDLVEMEKGDEEYLAIICKLKETDEKPLDNLPMLKVRFK